MHIRRYVWEVLVATFLLVRVLLFESYRWLLSSWLSERYWWLLSSWLVFYYSEAIGGYFPPGWFGWEVSVATSLLVGVLLFERYRWLLSSWLVWLRGIGGYFPDGLWFVIWRLSVAPFPLVVWEELVATFLLVGVLRVEGYRWLLSSWLVCLRGVGGYFPPGCFFCYLKAIGGYFPLGWFGWEVSVATFLLVGVLLFESCWWLLSSWLVWLRGIGGYFPPGLWFVIWRLSVAPLLLVVWEVLVATFLLVCVLLFEGYRWLLSSWLVCLRGVGGYFPPGWFFCYVKAIGGYFPPGWFGWEVSVATFLMVGVLLFESYWWLLSSWLVRLKGIGGYFHPAWGFVIWRLSVSTFLLVGLSERYWWLLSSWLVFCCLKDFGGYFPPGWFVWEVLMATFPWFVVCYLKAIGDYSPPSWFVWWVLVATLLTVGV